MQQNHARAKPKRCTARQQFVPSGAQVCTVRVVGTRKTLQPETLETVLQQEQLKRGINQTQAAELIGVSRAVYSRWISGRVAMPSTQNLQAVAAYLHINQRRLLDLFPDNYALRGTRGSSARQIAELTDEVAELRRIVTGLVDNLNTAINTRLK
jgi:transcriptional regulator with XRE-family HTH domain